MNNSDLINRLANYKNIIIFGYDSPGRYLRSILKNEFDVDFCDNSKIKQGTNQDANIYSVEESIKVKNAAYILKNTVYKDLMAEQLKGLGVREERIIWGQTDELIEEINQVKKQEKFKPIDEIQFEIDVVQHCNLNCKCCSQFSSIAEESYLSLKQMEKDFARLSELFDGKCKRIYLIGGEPLLHPNIIDCMKIARKYFTNGDISIFTNGLLLLKEPDDFWKACRENEISIIITRYPIELDYEMLFSKAKNETVQFSIFQSLEDFKYMINLGLDLEGNQDIKQSFTNCVEANNCIKLADGKLYTCTRPAAIHKFNKYFGLDLKVQEEDFIDIYKAKNREEILKKLSKPIPFCRYCNILGDRRAREWGQTEGKIEEWC